MVWNACFGDVEQQAGALCRRGTSKFIKARLRGGLPPVAVLGMYCKSLIVKEISKNTTSMWA
jgi:hypothetical protein